MELPGDVGAGLEAIVNELNESIFNGFSKIDFDFFFIFMNRLKNKMCVSIPYEDIKHALLAKDDYNP